MSNKRIKSLEKELKDLNIIKAGSSSLETICTNITNRIETLNRLRIEIEDISKNLYYYDMIDYLGSIPRDTLQLKQIALLIKDLASAEQEFKKDSDMQYIANADQIKKRLFALGLQRCEEAFVNGTNDGMPEFLELCDGQQMQQLKRTYFSHRKRHAQNELTECISDLKKNYKLVILGEIRSYRQAFGADLFEDYAKTGFPKDAYAPDSFESFIVELFARVFKKLSKDDIRRVAEEMNKESLDGQGKILRQIVLAAAHIYYGHGMPATEKVPVEI